MRTFPNFTVEKKFKRKGYVHIIGVDEAGRGPLAGPVVGGAVIFLNVNANNPKLGINDSKKMTSRQREKVYDFFKKNSSIEWGIGIVSEKIIDKINILEATKLAMIKAVRNLEEKLKTSDKKKILIIDGNIKLDINLLQKSIIKADQNIFSCALASIFAKVTRDKIMQKYHKKYPEYGFDKHKGYGTAHHFRMIKKYGACRIHRQSFHPVKR